MNSKRKQEFTLRIAQANGTQLTVLLYEIFSEYITEAKEYYKKNDTKEFRNSIRKSRECLEELKSSLNYEDNLANLILQLYIYVSEELTKAFTRIELEHLNHALKVMEGLQEAYKEVSRQDTSEPLMKNAQTIFAGLTYGKDDLTENLNETGDSRGFFV